MKKNYVFGIIALLAIGFVAAGYTLANDFVISTSVKEPLEVQYKILGDGVGQCNDTSVEWDDGGTASLSNMYAGASRKVCAKIENLGEGTLPFEFKGEAEHVYGDTTHSRCEDAFGNPSVSGNVTGLETEIVSILIDVAADAMPVNGCKITLSVERG